ncbi:MAG: response regulator [Deltaproteobacteria bacterium]|nr:response regulator [Deltaproteobacteria bacterium]MBI2500435.1 response regulator [Deltaproteobacteria bacterium]
MTSKRTILVVDDEVDLCTVLRKILTREGYSVLIALEGGKVLPLLKRNVVDLVLLDLKMPKMDGIEVLKAIRRKIKKPIPVIILTAHGSLSSAREAMELGSVDYLTKPFNLQTVKKAVREALGED